MTIFMPDLYVILCMNKMYYIYLVFFNNFEYFFEQIVSSQVPNNFETRELMLKAKLY